VAKPSLYQQINAVQVTGNHMKVSPRHWNAGLLKHKGRLAMCYRYHLGLEHASRCATAMVFLDRKTHQPLGPSQHLNLPSEYGGTHFEDARLFTFLGEPYISYTAMWNYTPGVDYNCVMRYSKLKLIGSRWTIEDTWQPKFGNNHGRSKEKNWIFFEHEKELYCIYQDHPTRKVLKLKGEKVVAEYESPAPAWEWGEIRGGTPPVPYGKNQMLAVFHSSLATEDAPHYRRYYGAAYTFDAKPPFAVTSISLKPIMSGSEEDNHGFDPRYSAGWKPFIPFPCGLVPDGDEWLVSLGVNDWQCAVGRIGEKDLELTAPDGSERPMRYFTTINGSKPLQLPGDKGEQRWINWEIPRSDRRGAMAPAGYMATKDGRVAEALVENRIVEEITEAQYNRATKPLYQCA
jgi:predicted GH43/DUF377 family glycosyl hydrolase